MTHRSLPARPRRSARRKRIESVIGYGSLGLACIIIGAAIGTPQAHALVYDPDSTIEVAVVWDGFGCMAIDVAVLEGGSEVQTFCGGILHQRYPAKIGDMVGADPVPETYDNTGVSCAVTSNGQTIAAAIGGTADCLGYLS